MHQFAYEVYSNYLHTVKSNFVTPTTIIIEKASNNNVIQTVLAILTSDLITVPFDLNIYSG